MKNIIQYYNNIRYKLLYKFGIYKNLINDYPKDLWDKLEKYFYCGNPVSVLLQNGLNLGKCHDRAYALTMAFDKCDLIRGSLPRYGKINNVDYDPNFEHSWVEDDTYVYDTTFLKKFDKKFYYYIFGAQIDKRISSEELNNDDYYKKMKATTKEDIEKDYGTLALNAYFLNAVLEQQEKIQKKDLSYLKCQVPKIDMKEVEIRQKEKLKKLHEDDLLK